MKPQNLLPVQKIQNSIFTIRGVQVMIDSDLAELYEVELKRLNEQVKRNIERFPNKFRFQLTKKELVELKSQFATSSETFLRSQNATLEKAEENIVNIYPMSLLNREFQCYQPF